MFVVLLWACGGGECEVATTDMNADGVDEIGCYECDFNDPGDGVREPENAAVFGLNAYCANAAWNDACGEDMEPDLPSGEPNVVLVDMTPREIGEYFDCKPVMEAGEWCHKYMEDVRAKLADGTLECDPSE
jgi:hypothetical protein